MAHEYLIVLPIEAMPAKSQYHPGTSLPLHCTVMPWFSLGSMMFSGLFCEFEEIAARFVPGSIELVSEYPALFGANSDVPVHVLASNPALRELHARLYEWLAETNSVPKEERWVRNGYRPHVSTVEGRDFPPGSRHHPTGLVLISRPPSKIKYVISALQPTRAAA